MIENLTGTRCSAISQTTLYACYRLLEPLVIHGDELLWEREVLTVKMTGRRSTIKPVAYPLTLALRAQLT
jgi:hypothetical protein